MIDRSPDAQVDAPLDAATDAAIRLARELPLALPDASHREQVRTALLARIAALPRRGRRSIAIDAIVAAVAVAAAAVLALALWPGADGPRARGTVRARADARYTLAAPAPDELVRLIDGTIDVTVAPLARGERFRVVVGDDEVEVRGTAFAVTAARGRLVAVAVAHGRVEVRPRDGTAIVLGAGERWRATPAAAAAAPITAPVAPTAPAPIAAPVAPTAPEPIVAPAPPAAHPGLRPRPAHAGSATAIAPRPRAAEALAYDDGWSAMRASEFHRAAAAFGRALALAPDGPLADDARFWHAVALARDARRAEAIAAFRELLDDNRGGAHRGEASAMLGWLLVDASELDDAARRFTAAADDPDPAVARSARDGLAALARRR